jgi:hypothetical protein
MFFYFLKQAGMVFDLSYSFDRFLWNRILVVWVATATILVGLMMGLASSTGFLGYALSMLFSTVIFSPALIISWRIVPPEVELEETSDHFGQERLRQERVRRVRHDRQAQGNHGRRSYLG